MRNDLIDRQAAIDALDRIFDQCEEIEAHLPKGDPDITGYKMYPDYMTVWKYLHQLPSAEPKRRKGRWQIADAYPHNVYCSECHAKFAQTHWAVWEDGSLPRNFCPNCGAKMTEGQNETD